MIDRKPRTRTLAVGFVLVVALASVAGVVATESIAPDSQSTPDAEGTNATSGAEFTVDILLGTVNVEQNTSYSANAVVENTGDETGTQDIVIRFNGTVIDVKRGVTLSPGGRTGVDVSFNTTGFAPGDYNVTLSSEDHTDTLDVTVKETAFFDVEITDVNMPSAPGPPIEVGVTVTNTGEVADTQKVQFYFEGELVSDTFFERTLAGGESASGELGDATNNLEPGEYQIGVRSEDDAENRTVVLGEPPEEATFDLRQWDSRSVEAGQTLEERFVVQNTGLQAGTQTLTFEIDGEVVDTEEVTLDSRFAPVLGDQTVVSFTYETDERDVGTHTMNVSSENSALSKTLTVTEPEDDEKPEDNEDPVHWQVDFGEGSNPPAPPAYWPNDLMAALGNSTHGVLQNPSLLRQDNESQLGAVNIVGNEFEFDDEGDPTNVTVEFELEDDAEPRDLHLAVYTLPGPFDPDELEQQELFEVANGTYEGGDTGELTVSIPQPEDDTDSDST